MAILFNCGNTIMDKKIGGVIFMDRLLYPISEEVFKKNVKIYFENINEGFSKFKHDMIEDKSEDELIEYMQNAYDENGFDNFYIDLYLNRIDESNEDKFINMLSDEDKKHMML